MIRTFVSKKLRRNYFGTKFVFFGVKSIELIQYLNNKYDDVHVFIRVHVRSKNDDQR